MLFWLFDGSYTHDCMHRNQVTTTAMRPLDHRKPWLGWRHTPCSPTSVSSVGARGPARISAALARGGSAISTAVRVAVIPVQHTAAMCCPDHTHRISVHVFALSM